MHVVRSIPFFHPGAYLLYCLLLFAAPLFPQATLPPDMVFVQGGTFVMGCTGGIAGCDNFESPDHEVTLSDFYMGRYEITQGQWESLMGYTQAQMRDLANPSWPLYGVGSTIPIYCVSWYDAVVFCNRLSEQAGYVPCYYADAAYTQVYGKSGSTWSLPNTGTVYWRPLSNGYRLPTEAEWEYAARGGGISKGYKYAGTSDPTVLKNYCNYWNGGDGYDNMASPVGTFLPNEIGLFDMSGNLWEWCFDWFDFGYYSSSPACAPLGPETGSTNKVFRSASWRGVAFTMQVWKRNYSPHNFRGDLSGFRLCRTP